MNMFVSLSVLICVLIQTPLISSDELEVFAIVRHMFDPQPKVKNKKDEFKGEKLYLENDRLDLQEPSDWFFTEFYMFNWKDTYNLFLQKCHLDGNNNENPSIDYDTNKYDIYHYAKNVKGTLDKRSKKKYLKIDYNDYNLREGECKSLYKFTIEEESKEQIEHPATEQKEEYTEEKINKVIVKRFYVYICD